MSETMSLHEQALECAAVATAETWSIHGGLDSVEDVARRLIRSADPLHCAGTNSEGAEILFDWSFSYEDIPAITAGARALLGDLASG
jgi:hypothetical protein